MTYFWNVTLQYKFFFFIWDSSPCSEQGGVPLFLLSKTSPFVSDLTSPKQPDWHWESLCPQWTSWQSERVFPACHLKHCSMDSDGRKVVVCDNGTGVRYLLSIVETSFIWAKTVSKQYNRWLIIYERTLLVFKWMIKESCFDSKTVVKVFIDFNYIF